MQGVLRKSFAETGAGGFIKKFIAGSRYPTHKQQEDRKNKQKLGGLSRVIVRFSEKEVETHDKGTSQKYPGIQKNIDYYADSCIA